ncbi:MAG TPA: HAD hydrolase-like protein [Rickettsiales bacterium]|nr:HAD hydrolase-like protein [Rickettsiales bacterium]
MLIICWDFDGTLVSSEIAYRNIFVKYFKDKKENNINSSFAKYGGKQPINVFNDLKKEGVIEKNLTLNISDFESDFKKEIQNNSLLLTKDIEKILEKLNSFKNTIMAIVTSTNKQDFELKYKSHSINVLKKYFNIDKNIYICSEVGNKELKPSPNGYLYAINDIISKNNIISEKNILITIEDSVSGCASALSAKNNLKNKIETIIIGYPIDNPYTKEEELKKSGADFVFKTPKELLNFLENLAVRPGLEPR